MNPTPDKPWGVMDPNTQHQLWSAWRFTIMGHSRLPLADVEMNARRWLRQTFRTSIGEYRVRRSPFGYLIECYVEGIPAHDPSLVTFVRLQFQQNFVTKGFGPLASSTVTGQVIAGDAQDGRPRAQMLVLPHLASTARIYQP